MLLFAERPSSFCDETAQNQRLAGSVSGFVYGFVYSLACAFVCAIDRHHPRAPRGCPGK